MKKFLFLFFSIVFQSQAQILVVQDAGTKQHLESVTIYSALMDRGTFTNASGRADISELKNATDIQIRFVGYRTRKLTFRDLERLGFVLLLEPENISLNTVVISASRWEQSSREVPNKITRISATESRFQNPQTTAHLLEGSGMVYVQRSQLGGGSPMIRGFATNRVLITVDGIRMNTAIFRSGNVQNVISLDAFATESTEVVFGPGSSIYGSDAIGGVMNFYTLSPQLSSGAKALVKGNATVRYSSANHEKTSHFDVNLGLKKWAFLSSVTYSDFDDLLMGKYGPKEYLRNSYVQRINGRDSLLLNPEPRLQKPSGYDQWNVMQKIRFAPNEFWDINYAFHYSKSSAYSRYDRLMRPRNQGLFSAEWQYGPQVWMMNALNVSHFKSNFWYDNMTFRLAHQFFEESRIDRNFGSNRRRIRLEQVNAYSANMDFEKRVNAKGRLFYGLEYVLNKVGSLGEDENINTGVIIPASTRYPNGSEWYSGAAYGSYQRSIAKKLSLQASGRLNKVGLSADFDNGFYPFPFSSANIDASAITGSLGLVYNPDQDWQIGINASSGFRSPNIDDVGKVFDSSPGFVIVPNPDLSPEYSRNIDLAIAHTIGSKLKVDATVFYNHLNNALVRRDFKFAGQDSIFYDGQLSRVQAIQNVAYAKVWGLQLGFEWLLPKGFSLSSRYNWQKGNEELDDESLAPLRHAPPAFGLTRINYQNGAFRAELYAMYNGEVPFSRLAPEEAGKEYIYAIDKNGNPFSPAWFTLNLKAQYQLNPSFLFNTGFENILNERYRPYSSGIVAPGRNFIISLRATF
jgi:hemoglobin/transferrin/lactoferrin receptor protein